VRVAKIHHEGTKGTKDTKKETNKLLLAPFSLCVLRALRAFVVDQLTISTYSRSLHGLCASLELISAPQLMINYRVDDLDAVLAVLRAEGCEVDPRIDESEFGRFGWVMDPEGNRLEL
jgi:hypothetical protein